MDIDSQRPASARDLLLLMGMLLLIAACVATPPASDTGERQAPIESASSTTPSSDPGVVGAETRKPATHGAPNVVDSDTAVVPSSNDDNTAGGLPDNASANSSALSGSSPSATLHAAPAGARLESARLTETSGLAVSRRDPDVLWAINDSGNDASLHALSRSGRSLGEWPVDARNRDWEDLAAIRIGNVPFLLIADTGDNLRHHLEYALHLVKEPRIEHSTTQTRSTHTPLHVAHTVRFRYEDGPHDVEAVAIDELTSTVWLLVKEPVVDGVLAASGVYSLSLDDVVADLLSASLPDPGGPAAKAPADETATSDEVRQLRVARRATTMAQPARSLTTRLAAALTRIDLEQPTAFDISIDGHSACLLSYRHIRCFTRGAGEPWSETLSRPGTELHSHDLDQAEALTLSTDRLIWYTSEGLHAELESVPLR